MIVLKSVARAWIKQLAFAPSGTSLAAAGGACGLLVWNELLNGTKAQSVKTPTRYVNQIAYTPDGERIIAAESDVCVVQLATREAKKIPVHAINLGFAPAPDSLHAIVCEPRHGAGGWSARSTCWPLNEPAEPKWEAQDDVYLRFGPFFVNAEHYLIMGWHRERGCCLLTRSATTGELVSEVPLTNVPENPSHSVLSPDATRVAGVLNTFLYVQPAGGPFTEKPVARNDNKKHFADLAYHPSGRYIATASNDETVKFYDTTTWELVRTFTWKTGKMRAVAFSPDGNLVAAGGEKGRVVVWDVDL